MSENELTYLGESYNYAGNIYGTGDEEMSMSSDPNDVSNDIAGMIAYVDVLVSGDSKASKKRYKGKPLPLGNKYFVKTLMKCKDIDTKEEVDRKLYVNNVPTGRIPFTIGTKTNMKGLVPGILGNVEKMAPFDALSEIFSSSVPPCKKVPLEVIDNSNNLNKTQTHHVSLDDLVDLYNKEEHIMSNNEPSFSKTELQSWLKKAKHSSKKIERFTTMNTDLKLYYSGVISLFCYILLRIIYT